MTGKKPNKEQRFRARVRTPKLSFAEFSGERHSVYDLSLSGAFVSVKEPAAVGETVEMTLGLGTSETIEVRAVVRRSESDRGMGVEFDDMSEESFARLRRFLNSARSSAPAQ